MEGIWRSVWIFTLFARVLSHGIDSYTVSIQRIATGGTVRLECQIRGALESSAEEEAEDNIGSGFSLIWIKYDVEDPQSHILISHGETLLVEDDRYSLRVLRNEGIAVLRIDAATPSDSGMYQCQMPIDGENAPTSPIEVIVEERSENLSFTSGSSVFPSILWFLPAFLVRFLF